MFGKLLLIFIGIPFLEMMLLIKLGEAMGFWTTIWLVIVTGFVGALAARVQGMRAWLNLQAELNAGRPPGEQMIDALLIFVAGLVLITPGLLTDIAGFLLLIPLTRKLFKQWLRRKFDDMIRNSRDGGGGGNAQFFVR